MVKKGYVIQQLGYEYNDETYYRPEDGGGNPVVVIIDEATAKKRMMELEIKQWKTESIGHHCYSWDEIAEDENEFEKALEAMGMDPEDDYDLNIPKDATDEQIKRLIKASTLRFYEIIEVDVEEDAPAAEEINPSEEMLSNQDELVKKSKKGLFSSMDEFVSGNVTPTVPKEVTINDIKEVVKETEDNFLTIKDEMKKLRDEARVKVKSFFLKGMNKIFEMYPEVKTVSWRQYTPYFNDGEECTFSAHVSDFYVNGRDNYGDTMYGYDEDDFEGENVLKKEEMEYDWVNGKKVYKNPGSKSIKIYEAIDSFLNQLDDDDYKTMFGDHAIVIVKKDEVVVEEYDHD